ncbi:MAG: hypothetical protein HY279_04715, partial [Nitrospinae bacterium]|nr:hypothetical protein [Nitrospinota bacterium]
MIKVSIQKIILSPLLIGIFSIAIYINTLDNGFLFDDYDTIVNNAMIREVKYLPHLFKKDYFSLSSEMSYRPVVTLTYFFDYAIYGLNPWGYHLTNVLLHAVNGVILYIFLTLLINQDARCKMQDVRNKNQETGGILSLASYFLPLVSSLIFVTHPVLTEAVNAISFREDLLCFLFFISASIIYLKSSKLEAQSSKFKASSLQLSALSFYLLALFSKEMAVTLPLIVYGYERLLKEKGKRFYSVLLSPLLIGYAVVTLIYLYIRF